MQQAGHLDLSPAIELLKIIGCQNTGLRLQTGFDQQVAILGSHLVNGQLPGSRQTQAASPRHNTAGMQVQRQQADQYAIATPGNDMQVIMSACVDLPPGVVPCPAHEHTTGIATAQQTVPVGFETLECRVVSD